MTSGHSVAVLQAIDPAFEVAGDVINDQNLDLDTFDMTPGNLIFSGNTKITPFTPDKGVIDAFPSSIATYKTNVMNGLGSSDASVSGTVSGNSMYSKTPQGVNMQEERTGVRNNSNRQDADDFIADLARVMINMTIARTTGSDIIRITNEQRDKLFDSGFDVPETAKTVIAEFEELKDGLFEFDVDPGSSRLDDDDATKQAINEAIEVTQRIPDLDTRLAREGKKLNLGPLLTNYFNKAGLDNVDKIIVEMSDEEKQAATAPEQVTPEQQAMDGASDAAIDDANGAITNETMTTDDMETAPTDEASSDELVAAALRSEGFSDNEIESYLARQRSV